MTDIEEAETDPCVGTTIGDYLVLEQLGAGGMSAVYRVRHLELSREFAMKIILPEFSADPILIERLRREALAIQRLNHPNIVRTFEYGTAGGSPYIVMELLQGPTLHALLWRERALVPVRAARYTRQIALGLAAAHEAGFVHRDLKPGNLMVVPYLATGEERIKILDFGLVRSETGDTRITREDHVVGTPAYMAPEQFRTSIVGREADLYGLGIVIYEMLVGHPPFDGTFQEVINQQLSKQPDPLPPALGLEELVEWLLAKSPASRPTAREVVVDLDRRFGALLDVPIAKGEVLGDRAIPIVKGRPLLPPRDLRDTEGGTLVE